MIDSEAPKYKKQLPFLSNLWIPLYYIHETLTFTWFMCSAKYTPLNQMTRSLWPWLKMPQFWRQILAF